MEHGRRGTPSLVKSQSALKFARAHSAGVAGEHDPGAAGLSSSSSSSSFQGIPMLSPTGVADTSPLDTDDVLAGAGADTRMGAGGGGDGVDVRGSVRRLPEPVRRDSRDVAADCVLAASLGVTLPGAGSEHTIELQPEDTGHWACTRVERFGWRAIE